MLEEIYKEVNERFSHIGEVVIAGGAVRDYLLKREPKDYDIFILGSNYEEQKDDTVLALKQLEVLTQPEFHQSEPYLVSTVRILGQPIQIMLSPYLNMDDLISSFDWNTCLFGYNGKITSHEDPANIAPGKELNLQKITFPRSTLRRGFRFSERFNMIFKDEDLLTLCNKVREMPLVTHGRGIE